MHRPEILGEDVEVGKLVGSDAVRQLAASAMIAHGMGDDVISVLVHAGTAITRTIYAREFEKSRVRQAYPEGMEKVFGGCSVAATDER